MDTSLGNRSRGVGRMNDIKVIDDLLFSLYFYGKDKERARKDCEEVFNAWESIKRRLNNEDDFVSDENKEFISRVFEDICSDNILNIENGNSGKGWNTYREAKRHIARFPNHFKQIDEKRYYGLDAIEDEMWDYALSDLCYEEQEYMKLLFENFKKEKKE